jgi:hypothetical protein
VVTRWLAHRSMMPASWEIVTGPYPSRSDSVECLEVPAGFSPPPSPEIDTRGALSDGRTTKAVVYRDRGEWRGVDAPVGESVKFFCAETSEKDKALPGYAGPVSDTCPPTAGRSSTRRQGTQTAAPVLGPLRRAPRPTRSIAVSFAYRHPPMTPARRPALRIPRRTLAN